MVKTVHKAKKQILIKLGGSFFRLINLTEPLREDVEVFPGDPQPQKNVVCSYEQGTCRHNIYSVGDHNFHPHGDAPNHQNPQYADRGFEFWGLDQAFNKACLIDLSAAKEAFTHDGIRFLTKITSQHLLPHMARIKQCGAVVLRTGYDRWLEKNKKHDREHIPYLDKSAASMLAKIKRLKVIGTDSLTIDQIEENYAHRRFKDKLIVECLVNLHGIHRKHRAKFYLQTSPIAIAGATGGPILAYAYIPVSGKETKWR